MPHLLIVGAGPGISAATARRLGREGYEVGLVARREQPLRELADQLRKDDVPTVTTTADSGDPAALTSAIEGLVGEVGPVDVLLYNVSVGREIAAADLTPEQLTADLAAGAVGLQTAVRAVLPGMRSRGGGTVLVTGSGAADRPAVTLPSLGVQKAAVRALAHVLSVALAPEGVHVATVTIRGLVGPQITPERVAEEFAGLVAETAGPRDVWRTAVDLLP
jgi:NADP-dependent 3-hydroxy acid dehydrogenase YdfG